ncbi:hypothetical protein FRB96_001921 [Tulasnella sp. 330]|nr:hypothetical protein FRB96_001921 [Tulasnella sp. 330]KAG8879963.1 hypothetical protein FRB97_001262 [Tulasnella sp. 331]KAG8886452.1 hypothetical protein FRB98_001271 [Tulasnella sp. 332]
MPRAQQMFEAASILSAFLSEAGIPHAFYGGITCVALGSQQETEEIFCIVEGGFKGVRNALQNCEIMTCSTSSWSGRLYTTYHDPIPPIEIEILKAGETGPKRINGSTVMMLNRLPFLSISEFLRAKMNSWLAHGSEGDAADIIYVLSQYAPAVDINRIPEPEMDRFVKLYPGEVRQAWATVRSRYGL